MATAFKERRWLAVATLLAFLVGAMFWAKSRDSFQRIEFTFHVPGGESVKGVALLPKPIRPRPTVIFLHGWTDTLMKDGEDLQQLAELGVGAVSLEYNQTNEQAFDREFAALNNYLANQSWAMRNATAWIGFSWGAQRSLGFILKHPDTQPQVLVRISGGWIADLNQFGGETNNLVLQAPVLLVQGEKDTLFPVADVQRLAALLRSNGVSVSSKILLNRGHGLEPEWLLVIRLVGEYCKAKLTPDHPLPDVPVLQPFPFWLCELPAVVLAAWWLWLRKRDRRRARLTEPGDAKLTGFEAGLRITAAVLAVVAIADTALHLVPPHLKVSDRTLEIARRYLVSPKCSEDFETLADRPIWQGQRLKTLLEHVELANYTVNELVNWKVDDDVYRKFVLTPLIVGGDTELNWRRELWENFYPRIRHENTTASAAKGVVRFLRERVTIAPDYPKQPGVETMWRRQIVNQEDFEVIYTAALRSVGVPARLNAANRTEFWDGKNWQTAPRPVLETCQEFEK